MTGRLAKAQTTHRALKSSDAEIRRRNNSRGNTMALNAAAVWIYWALKLHRKQRGFRCWCLSSYQTSQSTLFYLCAANRNVCGISRGEGKKKHPMVNMMDWLISKLNREQKSDVSPRPCGGETLMCHQNTEHRAWGHGFYPSLDKREGTFHRVLAMPTVSNTLQCPSHA